MTFGFHCFSDSCVWTLMTSSKRVSVVEPRPPRLHGPSVSPDLFLIVSSVMFHWHPLPPLWNSFRIKICHIQEVFLTLRPFSRTGLPTPARKCTLSSYTNDRQETVWTFPPTPSPGRGMCPGLLSRCFFWHLQWGFCLSLCNATVVCPASRVQADSTVENISPWSNISDSRQTEKI